MCSYIYTNSYELPSSVILACQHILLLVDGEKRNETRHQDINSKLRLLCSVLQALSCWVRPSSFSTCGSQIPHRGVTG